MTDVRFAKLPIVVGAVACKRNRADINSVHALGDSVGYDKRICRGSHGNLC